MSCYSAQQILQQHVKSKLKTLNELYDKETNPERKERIRFWINEYYQTQYQLEHLCLNDMITEPH